MTLTTEEMRDYQRKRRSGTLGLTTEQVQLKQHDVNLWSHHRIRLAVAQEMWVAQGCACACCGIEGPELYLPSREWVVDHDRQCCPSSERRECGGSCTRGIVCAPCNSVLTLHIQDKATYQAVGRYLRHTD